MTAGSGWEIFDRIKQKVDELSRAAGGFPPGVKFFELNGGQFVFPVYMGDGGFPKFAEAFLVPDTMPPRDTFPREGECVAFDVLKTSPAEALAEFMRKFPRAQ